MYGLIIEMHVFVLIGLNVTEVAHDIQQTVSRYITSDLSLVNSYDTWHGMACVLNATLRKYASLHMFQP